MQSSNAEFGLNGDARYRRQEGTVRGYNPRKPGLYVLSLFDDFCRRYAHESQLWLRPGNSHSAKNALAFLDDLETRGHTI